MGRPAPARGPRCGRCSGYRGACGRGHGGYARSKRSGLWLQACVAWGGWSLMTEAPGSPGSVADNSEALLGPAKGRPQVEQPQSLRAGGGRGFQLLSELASWRACLHSHVRFTCGPRPLLGRGWDGGRDISRCVEAGGGREEVVLCCLRSGGPRSLCPPPPPAARPAPSPHTGLLAQAQPDRRFPDCPRSRFHLLMGNIRRYLLLNLSEKHYRGLGV